MQSGKKPGGGGGGGLIPGLGLEMPAMFGGAAERVARQTARAIETTLASARRRMQGGRFGDGARYRALADPVLPDQLKI